ncbi:MAG: amino acid permease [Gemmataceae bacterium]|nr:amino acid permease [Gemmataceae bacterium]
MLVQGKRPRELRWYHAGPMLFGDWGTSRLYVLGLAFAAVGYASIWFMLAMAVLLLAVGWAYSVICRLFPDGGGVYSSARQRSQTLAVIGAFLLCADYVVTAAISALDAFHYLGLPNAEVWAAGSILFIGLVNYFGPTKAGTGALVVALLTVALTLTVAVAATPLLDQARVERAPGHLGNWWIKFTALILAISGVEAVANMTGIMVRPVERTSRLAIWPVLLEIVILNLVLTVAMQALLPGLPSEQVYESVTRPDGTVEQVVRPEVRDAMLRVLATHYVGSVFAAIASLVFALLLLSAVNTAVTDLVSIQYMMARDQELPAPLGGLNRWGMPLIPLVIGCIVPVITVLAVPDVEGLAHLYAIGVVGAVAVNLGTCSTNFQLPLKRWERWLMMPLTGVLVAIWITIAIDKPQALAFAVGIMTAGLLGRWAAHNREAIRKWLLAPVPHPLQLAPELAPARAEALARKPEPVAPAEPVYEPTGRILVATRGGNPRLVRFALDQARDRKAELFVLFARHVAVPTMGSTNVADVNTDPEAQELFRQIEQQAAEAGVPVRFLYAVAWDVAEAILEMAATYGVDLVLVGASQRGGLWRTMKGDILQEVAQHLPERISLLIHA